MLGGEDNHTEKYKNEDKFLDKMATHINKFLKPEKYKALNALKSNQNESDVWSKNNSLNFFHLRNEFKNFIDNIKPKYSNS